MILNEKLQFHAKNVGDYDRVIEFLFDQGYKWAETFGKNGPASKRPFIYSWPDGDITNGNNGREEDDWKTVTLDQFHQKVEAASAKLTPEINSMLDSLDNLISL